MRRIQELQKNIRSEGIALALLMHPRDVFYYAGTRQPCNLVIPAEDEPFLMARRALEWVKADSRVKCVESGKGFNDIRKTLTGKKIYSILSAFVWMFSQHFYTLN
jgi:hypothetical protein